ncbi:MAG: M24 family metallopeptidase [archaeon]|nr:M24 family metallopeptidase [archaeon]
MNKKLSAIQKGCNLNDRIFSEAVKKFRSRSFKTELDVSQFIDFEFKKAGAKNAFPTIVASGKNAVEWHHEPTNRKLLAGFCVMDFGAKFHGYCSDMTRTIYLGEPSRTERRIYSIVKKTQDACIRKVKAGEGTKELYEFSRKKLGAYKEFFGHGLGHGLSKLIHAKPRISRKKGKLKEGDVITIEPGVYIPKVLGIRIEDDVLVTKSGHRVLSKSTKKLVTIKW